MSLITFVSVFFVNSTFERLQSTPFHLKKKFFLILDVKNGHSTLFKVIKVCAPTYPTIFIMDVFYVSLTVFEKNTMDVLSDSPCICIWSRVPLCRMLERGENAGNIRKILINFPIDQFNSNISHLSWSCILN